ncbi:MAG: haloacid dehalogenase [Stenotrophomonas rhizophila]|uniref:HAD superfamily hydrolase (TIGR01549 family) n=1 Tax=Stenotrophomonas rhizophila TaxID=216778 RepID=A0AAP5ALG8_9GAMM|nr:MULTISPECIES: HAD family hydrolase [Stenotrophomonas]MDF2818166.1 haloacid dehalogenase [Stenotrophomonas rhizophila]MDQ1064183.1 HAD superfamily hydrolase (TIGR01549 family) [Stenotrophomonas sp. SORGH_AS_0282]MDQ1110168.1 HAD superfamily hydrolase (TIGR01549 family) [Stenotrophomonas rhizophila]MDY0980806.1 HAD family hydrolase [Stenotrophomonas sp. CFBP8994]PAK94611.1 HAD family hydrolase [Stenotrophomonas rhizophila]
MNFPVLAITLDLDDTLWPFAPIGARIDQVLYEWMLQHSPATAAMYPVAAMRELRERSFRDNPHLHYDLSALRRLTLREALENSGADLALLEPAYEAFYAARNQVEFYPDAVDALARIAARVPVAALSNGNADLARIGLDHHFAFQLGSREHGAAKPAASIFHAACERLGVAPAQVLHVGDHIEMDVVGAMQAGLRGCWINRVEHTWHHPSLQPDLQFDTLTGLADWLDANASAQTA